MRTAPRFGREEKDRKRKDERMNAPASITPVFVADLLAEDERMPLYVHVIEHPDARVLVDTGMTELHPAVADLDPRLSPLSEQDFDLAGIDIVVSTHLHFDHCGGNHLFAGKPIYVQRRELDDARNVADFREWADVPGVQYVQVDGEHELLPGLQLVPAPGHTPGLQVVVVETAAVRSSSGATWRFGTASSTSRTPKATSTSRGGPTRSKARSVAWKSLSRATLTCLADWRPLGSCSSRSGRSTTSRTTTPGRRRWTTLLRRPDGATAAGRER
jgi:N-acyl homoserine lactone hydrolase